MSGFAYLVLNRSETVLLRSHSEKLPNNKRTTSNINWSFWYTNLKQNQLLPITKFLFMHYNPTNSIQKQSQNAGIQVGHHHYFRKKAWSLHTPGVSDSTCFLTQSCTSEIVSIVIYFITSPNTTKQLNSGRLHIFLGDHYSIMCLLVRTIVLRSCSFYFRLFYTCERPVSVKILNILL